MAVVKTEPEELPIIEPSLVLNVNTSNLHCDNEDRALNTDTKSDSKAPTTNGLQPLSMAAYEKIPCPICSHLYKPISIRDHIRSQHGNYDKSLARKECDICQKVISLRTFTAHMQKHVNKINSGGIVCLNCDMSFMSLTALQLHMEEHTEINMKTKQKMYVCMHCDSLYKTCHSLREHLSKKHRKSDAPVYECTQCNLKYGRMRDLMIHYRRHSPCDICHKYFPTPLLLKQHRIMHGGSEQYECFACHRTFSQFSTMRSHTQYCHLAEDDKYLCSVCQKTFENPSSWRKHMLLHEGRSFTCHKCNRTYSSRDSLANHTANHRQCDVCHKYVLNEIVLQRHMIEHIDNYAFECFVCQNRYTSYKQVRLHVRAAHTTFRRKIRGKRRVHKIKNHLCSQCGARFASACLLRSHLMRDDHQIAGGGGIEKPFECDWCKKRFKNITTLNDHTRRHTGQNPYKCEICGKSFPCSSSLCMYTKCINPKDNCTHIQPRFRFR